MVLQTTQSQASEGLLELRDMAELVLRWAFLVMPKMTNLLAFCSVRMPAERLYCTTADLAMALVWNEQQTCGRLDV